MLVPADLRQPERRQTLRNVAEQRDAGGLEIQQPRGDNAGDDDDKRDGPVLQPQLAGDQHREGSAADEQRRLVGVAQVADEVGRAFPEVPMRSLEPEQLGQLGACQVERQPGLEADQHRLREKADGVSGANQPGGKGDRRDHEAPRTRPAPHGAQGRLRSVHRPTRR